jgi:cell division protein FtsQ
MAHGQVSYAALTRSFPDTLIITLQERTPVARIQVSDRGVTKQLLVAKDGVVYDGINYEKELLASLPWLDGFSLRRADSGGFEPIPGMPDVAELLTTAQIQAPHLYREWLIVSLARLAEHRELVVKAQDIERIVFTAKEDYFMQLARLDHVIDATRREVAEPTLKLVNLALGSQVPVTLAKTPEELAKQQQQRQQQQGLRDGRLHFPVQPSPQRKRDL